jgi:riboflavin biosynthesis pyrimidine reductase
VIVGDEAVDLRTALDELDLRGHRQVLTEGGPRCSAS